jgi:hypothetical protein
MGGKVLLFVSGVEFWKYINEFRASLYGIAALNVSGFGQ